MKLLFVLAAFCFVFVSPADAAIVTASEMPVSPPVPDTAPFDQTQGRIASDGDGFLAVWVDRSVFDDDDVLAMPLTADGTPAGDLPMSIAATGEAEQHPLVAWNGERYLVVWTDEQGIYSRLVGRDRTVSERILISGGFARAQMAFNGRTFLLAWRTSETNFHFVVLDRLGAPVRYFDTFVAQGPQAHAVVAIGETFYLVSAVSDFNGAPGPLGFPADVGITEIAENGTVGTRRVLAPATTPVFDLNAAATATDLLIGWSTAIGIPGGTIRTARFAPGGEVTLGTIPAEEEFLYDVVAKGNDYWLFYGNDSVKRVRAGMNASTDVVASSPPSSFNDVATNGNTVVAVERTFGRFETDLYARNVVTASSTPLATAPRHQSAPDVAHVTGQRMVVWNENNAIYANGLLLDTATPSSDPRVAAGGQEFLVVWRDGTDIAGMRLTRTGVRIDATPFGIVSGVYSETAPAVAWDGNRWVVVYARGERSPRGVRTTMYAVRISSGGSVSPEITLSNESENEYPAVAAGSGHALVVWRSGPFLQGATLTEGGTVMPVVTFPPHLTGAGQPSVAWNGSRYLVAAQVNGPSSRREVQWYLVTAGGTVTMPPIVFPAVSTSAAATDVTLLGNHFLVTWQDGDALLAGAVTSDGPMTDGPALIAPQVTSFAVSQGTVVYARNIDHPSRGVTRVFTKEMQVHGGLRRRAVR